jgi:hypothetical protein
MTVEITNFSLHSPSPRLLPPAPPHTFLGVAHSMIKGVRALADTSPTPSLALALVGAHVLECTLKAYLSRDGSDSSVRGSDIRHNLSGLWLLAYAQGLQIPSTPPSWVTTLGQIHGSPYHLRYLTGVHGLCLPSPEPMATELKFLLDLVQASINHGTEP